MVRPHDQLDLVSARVLEREKLLDAPLLAFGLRSLAYPASDSFELGPDTIHEPAVLQVEADDVVRGVALEIHQRVVARVAAHRGLVAAEVGRLALAAGELQADD